MFASCDATKERFDVQTSTVAVRPNRSRRSPTCRQYRRADRQHSARRRLARRGHRRGRGRAVEIQGDLLPQPGASRHSGQERFAARLGDLVAHPTSPGRSGSAAILELDATNGRGRADRWHTDVTFVDAYPKISVLRGVVIPAFGGDTVWANTVAAYEALPPALKTLAESLWAVHSNLYDYAAARPQASSADVKQYEEVFTATVYETEHPVVRVLPRTGAQSLVLGHFVRRFVGYSQSDSNHLFELFQSHVTRLENTVRWRWNAGDVAMWDNTATQHCAINDYGDQKRVVRRSTIRGEVPVSVDGRTSVTTCKTTKSTASAHSRQPAAA